MTTQSLRYFERIFNIHIPALCNSMISKHQKGIQFETYKDDFQIAINRASFPKNHLKNDALKYQVGKGVLSLCCTSMYFRLYVRFTKMQEIIQKIRELYFTPLLFAISQYIENRPGTIPVVEGKPLFSLRRFERKFRTFVEMFLTDYVEPRALIDTSTFVNKTRDMVRMLNTMFNNPKNQPEERIGADLKKQYQKSKAFLRKTAHTITASRRLTEGFVYRRESYSGLTEKFFEFFPHPDTPYDIKNPVEAWIQTLPKNFTFLLIEKDKEKPAVHFSLQDYLSNIRKGKKMPFTFTFGSNSSSPATASGFREDWVHLIFDFSIEMMLKEGDHTSEFVKAVIKTHLTLKTLPTAFYAFGAWFSKSLKMSTFGGWRSAVQPPAKLLENRYFYETQLDNLGDIRMFMETSYSGYNNDYNIVSIDLFIKKNNRDRSWIDFWK